MTTVLLQGGRYGLTARHGICKGSATGDECRRTSVIVRGDSPSDSRHGAAILERHFSWIRSGTAGIVFHASLLAT